MLPARPATPEKSRALTVLAAWLVVLSAVAWLCAPLFQDLRKWGGHDWDMVTSFRYLTVQSLREYGQLPGWNPYACGGYTAWGYVESDTNLVSPWLPLYLLLDLRLALRLEVVGSMLVSAAGVWVLAGRFTRSAAARALACVVFVINARATMQAATGHAMHLYYAWAPWALAFFDRSVSGLAPRSGAPSTARSLARAAGAALVPRLRPRDSVLAGAFIALMVYTGAIYPLPQTLVLLASYALVLSLVARRALPLVSFGVTAAVAFGLSAPKLFPIADAISRHPRVVESREAMGPGLLVELLTSRAPVPVPQWGWHEWGIYVGWASLAILVLGALLSRGPRETALKWTGILLVVLGMGAFHPRAPWTLLHELPVFRSQHVPSRWLYPALLIFAVLAARAAGELLERGLRRSPVAEILALAAVACIAIDAGTIARGPFERAFWMELAEGAHRPNRRVSPGEEHPRHLHYVKPDWAPPRSPG
ncbi:MAG: hypothetical protein R3B70_30885 [Polyangiaceae bacterium]